MTYNDWLEKELNIYKRENKLLNEKIDSLADIYVTVGEKSKKLEEHNDKKNEFLKWAYSLEKENKKLQQQIEGLTSENFELQNELFTQQLNEGEADSLIKDFRKQNIELMEDLDTSRNQYNKIFKENKKLQQQTKKLSSENVRLQNELFNAYLIHQHNSNLISELKLSLSSYNNFVDEMFPE